MKTIYLSELKELANKQFTSIQELEEAEAAVNKEIAKKQLAAKAKKADAEVVEKAIVKATVVAAEAKVKKAEAYAEYRKVCDEQDKLVDEADLEKEKALHEFCDKYPEGFHETIKIGGVETKVDYTRYKNDKVVTPTGISLLNFLANL